MQVQELFNIEALHSFQLLAGESGLDNTMKDVVLLEYESLKQKTPDYYRGDFIVTTLFYAKDDPSLLLPVVERLVDLGASGLAVKSVYYHQLPEAVLELARQRSFPIFIFDTLFMEDVILSISDYIRLRQEFSMFEEPLSTLLSGLCESAEVARLCSRMNPGRRKYMCAAYIHAASPEGNWYLSLQDALRMRAARDITEGCRFLQFRRGFFLLFNSTRQPDLQTIADQCQEVLLGLGLELQGLHMGISDTHQNAGDFDCVIREAFDALTCGILFSAPVALFPELACHRMIFPMLRDKSARSANLGLLARLEDYDRDSGTGCLVRTLRTYAACGYDIPETASTMGQHPNTIRYRLKKIGELIGTSSDAGHGIFLLGEFLRLDSIRQMIF